MVVVTVVEVFKFFCVYLHLLGCSLHVLKLHVFSGLKHLRICLFLYLPTIASEHLRGKGGKGGITDEMEKTTKEKEWKVKSGEQEKGGEEGEEG